jgi:hypothetical protein
MQPRLISVLDYVRNIFLNEELKEKDLFCKEVLRIRFVFDMKEKPSILSSSFAIFVAT